MPRGLMNWTFDDVVRFLKRHGFIYNYTRGSHHYYIGHKNGRTWQVCVPFHGRNSIKPRTLKAIITQSNISKEEWLE